jgi:hypothetical protein
MSRCVVRGACAETVASQYADSISNEFPLIPPIRSPFTSYVNCSLVTEIAGGYVRKFFFFFFLVLSCYEAFSFIFSFFRLFFGPR